MPHITPETIGHLARLSRLELTPEQAEKFAHDLEAILGHAAALKKIDTEGIDPMIGATGTMNVMRIDGIEAGEGGLALEEAGRVMRAFPEKRGEYLKVPKVL